MVADLNETATRSLAKEFSCKSTTSWKNVVQSKDIDIVLICTPPNTHAPIAKSALRNKKHVLCEKPLARTLKEAKDMQAAITPGIKFKCGFNYRFHPAVNQAKQWLTRGVIGDPYYIRCVHGICGRPGYEKDWRANPAISGGGQLMDQGMHCLDLFRYFMGEFCEAFAYASTYYWKMRVEDNLFGILRTSRGKTASFHVSWTEWKNIFELQIVGERGYIRLDGLGGSYDSEQVSLGIRNFHKPFSDRTIHYTDRDRPWVNEWRNFIHAIEVDGNPSGSFEDGLRALIMTQSLYDSTRLKKTVAIKNT
jgi:predicted dehydrogenase